MPMHTISTSTISKTDSTGPSSPDPHPNPGPCFPHSLFANYLLFSNLLLVVGCAVRRLPAPCGACHLLACGATALGVPPQWPGHRCPVKKPPILAEGGPIQTAP